MKIYFHNIGKLLSFALNRYLFFALFVVKILFSNDIIKLIEFIKFTRANYLNIIYFLFFKKNLPYIFYIKTKIDLEHVSPHFYSMKKGGEYCILTLRWGSRL
jgi:hypothetical protein